MLTQDAIIEIFTEAVLAIEKKELSDLNAQTDLSTLGFDSVTTMEILSEIEERLNIEFPEEELGDIYLMSDLIKLVLRLT
jgi:acyl carrier protein